MKGKYSITQSPNKSIHQAVRNTNIEANLSASRAAIQSNPRALTQKSNFYFFLKDVHCTRWQIFHGQTFSLSFLTFPEISSPNRNQSLVPYVRNPLHLSLSLSLFILNPSISKFKDFLFLFTPLSWHLLLVV